MKRREFLRTTAAGTAGGFLAQETQAQDDSQTSAGIEWTRKIPLRYDTDVAVIGGGIAGVSAACAAARSGAKVVLVERFAITGGNSTTGGVASFCGETARQGEVFDEIVAGLQAFDAIAPYRPYTRKTGSRVFDHGILAIVLQELLLRRGVKLLLHTRMVDVKVKDGRITESVICGKSGLEALRAKQFIDCTGEADVTRAAGFDTVRGRPEDEMQLPMSMMFFVRHVEEKDARAQLPEGWFEPIRKREDLPMTSIWPNGPRSNALKIKIPMFDSCETESLAAAEIRARRRAMEVLDYYQRVEKKPWLYDHCSPMIGIREGCRIVGDATLRVEDLRAGRAFDDAVARGVFYLDGHKPDDDKRTYILNKDELEVPPYQIPFRCLIVRDGKNLMAAGRCLSADQLSLSSARVTTSCSMMGQATGIAAAMCVEKNRDPRELDYAEIRKVVEKRGARLSVG